MKETIKSWAELAFYTYTGAIAGVFGFDDGRGATIEKLRAEVADKIERIAGLGQLFDEMSEHNARELGAAEREIERLRDALGREHQAHLAALNQARPDSIKNTAPIMVLRALAKVAEEAPEAMLFEFTSEGAPIRMTAKEMLEACKADTEQGRAWCQSVIARAVVSVLSSAQKGD